MKERDPELEAWLADHPELDDVADDLEAVRAKLDAWGARRREDLFAEASRPAPAEDEAIGALRHAMGTAAAPVPARPNPLLRWGLVAAAAVVLLLAYQAFNPPGTVVIPDGYHVGGTLPLAAPVGEVDEWGTFRWTYELPAEGWFEVEVWNLDEDGTLSPALPALEEWTETSWTPTREQLELLGEDIQWQVRAYDASGNQVESGTVRSSLSR